jgi:hypothetical protein
VHAGLEGIHKAEVWEGFGRKDAEIVPGYEMMVEVETHPCGDQFSEP